MSAAEIRTKLPAGRSSMKIKPNVNPRIKPGGRGRLHCWELMTPGRSFMKIRDIAGPRIEPWGGGYVCIVLFFCIYSSRCFEYLFVAFFSLASSLEFWKCFFLSFLLTCLLNPFLSRIFSFLAVPIFKLSCFHRRRSLRDCLEKKLFKTFKSSVKVNLIKLGENK